MGTLRRHPDLRYRDARHLDGLHALQDRLLDSAACCVREGGSITYSVCTPLGGEGIERVRAFLMRNPLFTAAPITDEALLPYVTHHPGPEAATPIACLQTWSHLHACDSFFAVKLVRGPATNVGEGSRDHRECV